MNNTHKQRPDADLTTFDFAIEFADRPEQALAMLQELLLDDRSCQARCEYLRQMANQRMIDFPDIVAEAEPIDVSHEIALICDEGLFSAYEEGKLTPEVVDRLHRLTCNPEALEQAHQRLSNFDDDDEESVVEPQAKPTPAHSIPADAPTPIRSETSVSGFTSLARAGRIPELLARLRAWLPVLLRQAGLDESLTDDLQEFLRAKLKAMPEDKRFREVLPGWVADFAREQGLDDKLQPLPAEIDQAFISRAAVEQVLRRPASNEPDWAVRYREYALEQKVASGQELLQLEPPDLGRVESIRAYARDLYREVKQSQTEGFRLFELN